MTRAADFLSMASSHHKAQGSHSAVFEHVSIQVLILQSRAATSHLCIQSQRYKHVYER